MPIERKKGAQGEATWPRGFQPWELYVFLPRVIILVNMDHKRAKFYHFKGQKGAHGEVTWPKWLSPWELYVFLLEVFI